MSYCLNPHCSKPQNTANVRFCITCGTKILLGDRYRPLRVIGQGGFGRTFLAEDSASPSQRRCIIKQFLPQNQGDLAKAFQLFKQEAISLEKLENHPQIPNFYDYIAQNNYQYIIQQYIDGNTLTQELETEGVFSETKIIQLLKSLIPVLKFIHDRGIIHRDIKPDNIIRRISLNSIDLEDLVLIDFGAAKYATQTALAKTGTSIGSAEFVSPEQIRGKPIFASDIYSLGVTCLYLITHISPFELFDIHQDSWIWRDYLVDNKISDQLGQILDKMVANSLTLRYHNALAMLPDLERFNANFNSKFPNQPVIKPVIIQTNASNLNHISNNNLDNHWHWLTNLVSHKDTVRAVKFSANGEYLISGSWDNNAIVWDWQKQEQITNFKIEYSSINAIDISPNSEILATGSNDNCVTLWHLKNQTKLHTLKGHKGFFAGVNGVKFSPDGQYLASCGGDKIIKIWNVKTGQEISTLLGHERWISSVVFSPDGQYLASGSADKTVKLWDWQRKRLIHTFVGHLGIFAGVNCISFTPDGQYLASGSDDYTTKLWNIKDRTEVRTFEKHNNFVYSIAINPNGQILASGGGDNVIKLWELETGRNIATLAGHSNSIRGLDFSPDGSYLASVSDDQLIKLWQFSR
jgi:WD40 repeat protein